MDIYESEMSLVKIRPPGLFPAFHVPKGSSLGFLKLITPVHQIYVERDGDTSPLYIKFTNDDQIIEKDCMCVDVGLVSFGPHNDPTKWCFKYSYPVKQIGISEYEVLNRVMLAVEKEDCSVLFPLFRDEFSVDALIFVESSIKHIKLQIPQGKVFLYGDCIYYGNQESSLCVVKLQYVKIKSLE